jgi:hypothetical protein
MAENPVQSDTPGAAPLLPSPSGYSSHAIHLLRTTQQINLALSQMADTKASILMGATFLVFTICVGQASDGALPAALAVLAAFAFVSAICAVFAVLPSVGRPPPPGADQAKPNKLFFGHFSHREEAAWTEDILEDLRTDESAFRLILHDIYQNGQVLQHKKYRFLGHAYRSFMAGLVFTVITFAAELALWAA